MDSMINMIAIHLNSGFQKKNYASICILPHTFLNHTKKHAVEKANAKSNPQVEMQEITVADDHDYHYEDTSDSDYASTIAGSTRAKGGSNASNVTNASGVDAIYWSNNATIRRIDTYDKHGTKQKEKNKESQSDRNNDTNNNNDSNDKHYIAQLREKKQKQQKEQQNIMTNMINNKDATDNVWYTTIIINDVFLDKAN